LAPNGTGIVRVGFLPPCPQPAGSAASGVLRDPLTASGLGGELYGSAWNAEHPHRGAATPPV